MTKPQAIAFDLDGTLAESKQAVHADMGAAFARLLERMPVAVMSGASWAQFEEKLLDRLPAGAHLENLYLFPVSAASCYVFRNGAWTAAYRHEFSPVEKKTILKDLRVALAENNLTQEPPAAWGERIEDRGGGITFSGLGQRAPEAEKRAWDPSRAKRTPVWKRLLEMLPGYTVAMNATTSIDITPRGVTKALGVRKFSDMTGIPVPQMLYVGDALFKGGNDAVVKETGIPTLQVSGPTETAQCIEEILA